MVKLSRSQFAYRNQTKKQQTKTNYHKNTIIKLNNTKLSNHEGLKYLCIYMVFRFCRIYRKKVLIAEGECIEKTKMA